MSRKCCLKSVSGLTNIPKTYQKRKPSNNSSTSAWDWSDTFFNIKSKWSIGSECPFSLFRILSHFYYHPSLLKCSNKYTCIHA